VLPIAHPEKSRPVQESRERVEEMKKNGGITSAVCFELLSRGSPVYGFHFSFNRWRMARESSFGFSERSASRPKTFARASRHNTETLLTASGASGCGASMFGKGGKNCMTRCDPARH
jgi:hypothetical protein